MQYQFAAVLLASFAGLSQAAAGPQNGLVSLSKRLDMPNEFLESVKNVKRDDDDDDYVAYSNVPYACHASCGSAILAASSCSGDSGYDSACLCDGDFAGFVPYCLDCGWCIYTWYYPKLTDALQFCGDPATPTGDICVTTSTTLPDPDTTTTSSDDGADTTTSSDDGAETTTSSDDGAETTTSSDDGAETTTSSDDGADTTTSSDDGAETTTSSDDGAETTTSSDDGAETTTSSDDDDSAETTSSDDDSAETTASSDDDAESNSTTSSDDDAETTTSSNSTSTSVTPEVLEGSGNSIFTTGSFLGSALAVFVGAVALI